jgi:hypothetical protein
MNDLPLRDPFLELQEAGDDVLVHDPNRQKIHVLNASAAKVLEACDGRTSMREIAQRIAPPEYASRAYDDVVRIVEEFRTLGLLSA